MLKKCRILICLILVVTFFVGITAQAAQQQPITVVLDGEVLEFDVPPQIIDGRTMVSMRVIFEALGAEVVPFSPLKDFELPDDACGLVLWGGYPELHAEELSANAGMRQSLARAIGSGMPTYAESGGFMYLHESICDLSGSEFSMVGAIPGKAEMADRLQGFGYHRLTARRDNLLSLEGGSINAHFYHQSRSTDPGDCFTATRPNGATKQAVYATESICAGFQHLHFWGNPAFAESFVTACIEYRRSRNGTD